MMFSSKLWIAATYAAAAITGVANAQSSQTASVTYTNTQRFLFDVDGNQVDAYGSKINVFNGKYYLYGNAFALTGAAYGIKSYSSVDLQNWVYEGYLYNPLVSNPCNSIGGCGRPHIVYNTASKKYVLWANAGSSGYIIATSSSPSTGFEFASTTAMIDPALSALQPADFAVETFGDKGYIVFSALNFRDSRAGSIWPPVFQTLHISPLTSDFMNTTGVSYNVTSADFDLIDQEAESPDIFMRNGLFYVSASNTCGYCNGSIGLLYRSSSIEGPWTRQILAGDSCEGQVEGVLPLTDPSTNVTTYVWHSTSVPGGPRVGFSGHIFQPLVFNQNGGAQDLKCGDGQTFPVKFARGTGAVGAGAASTATDGSPALAPYEAVCDSDLFMLHQTWTASKTGTLESVGINIAGAKVQTTSLSIKVFKFSNDAALTSPEYDYTSLASASIAPSQFSYVFNVTTVAVNAAVTKGDRLGFTLAGADFAPYCHLEYPLTDSTAAGTVLYQQGAGQYSWRGAKGMKSPVYVRPGMGVKFFATIV